MVTFLSHFTPSMMSKEVIEQIFVQREDLASRLVSLVCESVTGGAKHHTLIVGPRGIGKTHLASLVYHRVRALPELTDSIRIAWLREEEWGVASFLDFLIRVLRALNEEYPDAGIAGRVEALFTVTPKVAERDAAALLDEFVGERTVFLIAENLDQLFEGLSSTGQQQFRAYLQERASWTIVATAPGLFNGISIQKSPFYGFFRIKHLQELSVDEAVELLKKIAESSGRGDLASFVRTPLGRARIRAVHHLAGGNHRIYVIFSEFLTRESLDELVQPFLTTMDHLTPYYQARMQSLSPQQRKIVDHLCEIRHAVPVKEIAQRCFITQQTASAQLKQLRERGYVRSFTVGRGSYHELTEPLMRLSLEVKKQRGEPIRLFVDFLRYWYTRPELEQRLLTLQSSQHIDKAYFLQALQEWDSPASMDGEHLHEWEQQVAAQFRQKNFELALEYAESLIRTRGTTNDYMRKANCLVGMNEFEQAKQCVENALRMDPANPTLMLAFGAANLGIGRCEEALEWIEKSSSVQALPAIGWSTRGAALLRLRRTEEAMEAYRNARALAPTDAIIWTHLVGVLQQLGRHNDALDVLDSVPEADRDVKWLDERGNTLKLLNRYAEGAQTYRAAIEVEETAGRRAKLASALGALSQFKAAEDEIERALALDEMEPTVWIEQGVVKLRQGHWEQALEAFRKAHKLDVNLTHTLTVMALCLEGMKRHDEALDLYQQVIATRTFESIPYFRRAVVLTSVGQWRESIQALDFALKQFGWSGLDMGTAADLLRAWFGLRIDTFWAEELRQIVDAYASQEMLPQLGTAITESGSALFHQSGDAQRARAWVGVWASIAKDHSELALAARLLRAGTEYHYTGDPKHLLELASEERAVVRSIPGLRPFHETY